MLSKETIGKFYDASSRCIFGPPQSMFPADLLPLLDGCIDARNTLKKSPSQQNSDEYWRLASQLGEMIQTRIDRDCPGYDKALLRNARTSYEILRSECKGMSDPSIDCQIAKNLFSFQMSFVFAPREIECDRSRPAFLRKYPELHR